MLKHTLLLSIMLLIATFSFGDEGQKAQIKFEQKVFKFDTISVDGKSQSYEFVFENKGTAPLVISRSYVNCKCTKVTYDKSPILPGKKGKIKVTFKPKGQKVGAFSKNIQIYSNAGNKREILTIMGVLK